MLRDDPRHETTAAPPGACLLTDPSSSGAARPAGHRGPSAASRPTILVIPTLAIHRAPSGRLVVPRKYLTGLEAYAASWPGKVVSALRVTAPADDGHLDNVEFEPQGSPFELRALAADGPGLEAQVRGAALVMLTDGSETQPMARLCRRVGVPYVLVLEWDWQTRRQNIWQGAPTPLRAAKRLLWAELANVGRVRTMHGAAGLQCNGTGAFESYRILNPRTLLYFDSRVGPEMIVAEAALEQRLAAMTAGAPLRLVFSGRLVSIKGADHLPAFAAALARRGVPFTLDICGGGVLENGIRAEVARRGLQEQVRMRGTLDFASELMPFVTSQTDLFVCCHTQGDPSCTYLETMACGVPIAGFGNSAWSGMVDRSGAGWSIPHRDPERLADLVATLAARRAEIVTRSRAARAFALAHTFDETMRARTAHLLACMEQPRS
jgi:colanic acid/amylovoran biosynthesis glycosyltransferase